MKVQERFLHYVSMWTTSDDNSTTTPSSKRQLDLANMLRQELYTLGLEGVHVDQYGYVYGTLPATKGYENSPALGFLAHMDTSPECSGKDVKPQIIKNYDGSDIMLGETERNLLIPEFPHLASWVGRTVITTDGTTLLGADDKAGIAEIMTAIEIILENDIPHGKICVGFTVDEEIGSGAELFDLDRFGADYAYTVDGGLEGEIEYENFNAASAVVTIHGVNIHPGSAKDLMVNSMELAHEFHQLIPGLEKPQHTEGYEGFFHLTEMQGCVETSRMSYIIRDFDMNNFQRKKEYLQTTCTKLNEKYGNRKRFEVKIEDSYYNMKEKIEPCMWIIDSAIDACKKADVEPKVIPIRGGTDGARLSFRGLPCPNIGTGGAAFHGVCEHISVEGMEKTVGIIINLVENFRDHEK
ncbi:MAG: peptidase T [Eubacteriales bacterium]|nr:peptidase T [Eubacteriales bacterium]